MNHVDLISLVADFLPLASAAEFAACVLDHDSDIATVLERHHSVNLEPEWVLLQVAQRDEFERLTPSLLEHIWVAFGIGFPWAEFGSLCAIRTNMPLLRFVSYSFSVMITEPACWRLLQETLCHNISNKREMLCRLGLNFLPLDNDVATPLQSSMFTKVFRCITKSLMSSSAEPSTPVVRMLCSSSSQHTIDWLRWFCSRYSVANDTRFLDTATAVKHILCRLVIDADNARLRAIVEGKWAQSVDIQPVLSVAVAHRNLNACAAIHESYRLMPLSHELDTTSTDIAAYFKYSVATTSDRLLQHYNACRSEATAQLKTRLAAIDQAEREQLEAIPNVVYLRDVCKRLRDEAHLQYDQDTRCTVARRLVY